MQRSFFRLLLATLILLPLPLGATPSHKATPGPAHTNPLNADPLVRQAFQHFYLMEYPAATADFERFHQLHPGDPHATSLLLYAEVFQELYRLDLLDTTFYANDGFLTGRHATTEDPAVRDRVFALADEAIREADWRIAQNPNDVDALYARAWSRALKCTYLAIVERSFGAGFRLAMKAREDASRALQIDPQYVDAKLVVGVYEYVVGALPLPFKILIGFAGITGSKNHGMELLHDAGERGTNTSVEARTVIALFLRREARYADAIQVVRSLKQQFPHNYLFCLEEANLRKDAGEGMKGVDSYRELLANAARPGYFAQARLELAYFGYGDALRGQRLYTEAAQAYEQAAYSAGIHPELKIRSMLAAGQCHDLNNQRALAQRDYQMAIDAGPATSRADQARHYLRSPYKGQ